MITEKERQAFRERMREMNDEIRENAKKEGIKIKSSIHDRWQYDGELYDQSRSRNTEKVQIVATRPTPVKQLPISKRKRRTTNKK